jgi:hypothetical protein
MNPARLALLAVLGTWLPGQVSVTVGPSPAPVGSAIAISVANDTAKPIFLPTPCPFSIRDEHGRVLFTPSCIPAGVPVPPGSVFTVMWDQVDDSGQKVPAGTYLVDVFFPGGTSTSSLVIDSKTRAGIAQIGPVRVGTTRSLYLAAPGSAGMPYVVGASGASTASGIQSCGGVVPLAADSLLELSLGPNPYFTNFAGLMEGMPTSTSPAVTVPNEPSLAGVKFLLAFVVIDPAAECAVRTISAPLLVVIR